MHRQDPRLFAPTEVNILTQASNNNKIPKPV